MRRKSILALLFALTAGTPGRAQDIPGAIAPRAAPSANDTAPTPGWLGVAIDPTPDTSGVRVRRAFLGQAAAAAGLRPGDVITRVDGHPVATPEALADRIRTIPAGTRVRLTLGGAPPREVDVVLRRRIDDPQELAAALVGEPFPALPLPVAGDDDRAYTLPGSPSAVRIVEFWADWCGPCRAIEPDVRAFVEKTPGVRLVAVQTSPISRAVTPDDPAAVRWQRVVDRDEEATTALTITVLPTWIIVDTEGRIAGVYQGVERFDAMREDARSLATRTSAP